MQIANIMLAIGGDTGNVISKYNVTASEIAVLRSIHGEDAVTNIKPVGEIRTTHRSERARLEQVYGRNMNGTLMSPAVNALFPGAAARLFETIDELELDDMFFAADARAPMKPEPVEAAAKVEEPARKPLSQMNKQELLTRAGELGIEVDANDTKAVLTEAIEAAELAAIESTPEDDDDGGVDDMDDANLFS